MTAFLRKFANWIGWGALGVLISIVAVVLSLDFKKTDVHMFVLSDTNLVDVKSPLNDLQVLYKGKDLIRENLRLHLYRIQIQNTGNTVILKDYFDDNDLWGIRVDSGTIVKIGQPLSDSSYIKNNIILKTPDQHTLRFTPLIFEPGDFFIIDFFVLASSSSPPPSLTAVGKIAGIRQILVTTSNLNRPSILYEAYGGEWRY